MEEPIVFSNDLSKVLFFKEKESNNISTTQHEVEPPKETGRNINEFEISPVKPKHTRASFNKKIGNHFSLAKSYDQNPLMQSQEDSNFVNQFYEGNKIQENLFQELNIEPIKKQLKIFAGAGDDIEFCHIVQQDKESRIGKVINEYEGFNDQKRVYYALKMVIENKNESISQIETNLNNQFKEIFQQWSAYQGKLKRTSDLKSFDIVKKEFPLFIEFPSDCNQLYRIAIFGYLFNIILQQDITEIFDLMKRIEENQFTFIECLQLNPSSIYLLKSILLVFLFKIAETIVDGKIPIGQQLVQLLMDYNNHKGIDFAFVMHLRTSSIQNLIRGNENKVTVIQQKKISDFKDLAVSPKDEELVYIFEELRSTIQVKQKNNKNKVETIKFGGDYTTISISHLNQAYQLLLQNQFQQKLKNQLIGLLISQETELDTHQDNIPSQEEEQDSQLSYQIEHVEESNDESDQQSKEGDKVKVYEQLRSYYGGIYDDGTKNHMKGYYPHFEVEEDFLEYNDIEGSEEEANFDRENYQQSKQQQQQEQQQQKKQMKEIVPQYYCSQQIFQSQQYQEDEYKTVISYIREPEQEQEEKKEEEQRSISNLREKQKEEKMNYFEREEKKGISEIKNNKLTLLTVVSGGLLVASMIGLYFMRKRIPLLSKLLN